MRDFPNKLWLHATHTVLTMVCVFGVACSGVSLKASEEMAATPDINIPQIVLQQNHIGAIRAVAIAPDGKTVATGGEDNCARVWNLSNGELIFTLIEHDGPVGLVAFSPDSRRLVTGEGHWHSLGYQGSGTLRFWDLRTGRLQRTVRGPGHVQALAISPDWKIVARAGEQWTYDDRKYSGKCLVTLWDVQTGKLLHTFTTVQKPFHTERVDTLVFSPDGRMLAGAGFGSDVEIWDVAHGVLGRSIARRGGYQSIAFSPDGKAIASALGRDSKPYNEVCLWDIPTGKLRRVFAGSGFQNGSLTFSHDGTTLVSGDFKEVSIWNLRTAKREQKLALGSEDGSLVALSPDDKELIGIGNLVDAAKPMGWSDSDSSALNLWQRRTGKLQWTVANRSVYEAPLQVALQQNNTLSIRAKDGTTHLWDASTAKLLRTFESRDGSRLIALSQNGRVVVRSAPSNSEQGLWKVWNTESGSWQRSIFVPGGGYEVPTGGYFSHDGRKFVVTSMSDVGGYGGVTLWDLQTGKAVPGLEKQSSEVLSLDFSPDDSILALGCWDRSITLWDAATGTRKARLATSENPDRPLKRADRNNAKDEDGSITAVAFSPDGTMLAGGDEKGRLRLWDVRSQSILHTWSGHVDRIMALRFSPDGQRVVSGGNDRILKVWDVPSGNLLSTLKGHLSTVTSAVFLPKGDILVSASSDGTVRFWNSMKGELLATFALLSARSLPSRSSPVKAASGAEWIVVAPGGYYEGSQGVNRFIRWRTQKGLWPAEKFSAYHDFERVRQKIFEDSESRQAR